MKKLVASLLLAFSVYVPVAPAAVSFPGDNANTPRLLRSSGFPTTDPFSATFWIYMNSVAANQELLALIDGGANNAPYQVYVSSTAKLNMQSANGGAVAGATTISTSTWYFVAVVVSGGTATIYLNGVSEAVNSNLTGGGTEAEFTLGSRQGDRNLSGRIAAFKAWSNVALSVGEVQNEQWSYRPKHVAGLYMWQPLLSYVSTETDICGLGNDLAYSGAGTLSTAAGPPISW